MIDDIVGPDANSNQFQILRLSSDSDGIQQITDYLSGYQQYDAIHVISHGTEGRISLGSTELSTNTVHTHQNNLLLWANNLTENADILLYGCDLASTDDGIALISSLAELTTADVAASDNVTGHESFGADWVLEYNTGNIEARLPLSDELQNDWTYTLATPDDVSLTDSSSGGLTINDGTGSDTYLLADNGSDLLTGLNSLTLEMQFSLSTTSSQATLVSYLTTNNVDELRVEVESNDLFIEIGGQQVTISDAQIGALFDGEIHSLAVTWSNTAGV